MWKWRTRQRAGEDTPLPDEETDEGMTAVVIECAWCLAEQGIVPVSGSHGICAFHAQQMLDEARERHRHRVGG